MNANKQRQVNFQKFLLKALLENAAPGTDLKFRERQFYQVRSVEEEALKLAGGVKAKDLSIGDTAIWAGNLYRKLNIKKYPEFVLVNGPSKPVPMGGDTLMLPATEERAAEILG